MGKGKILHEYLLNRMIFDAETGKAPSGTYRANRYYRLFYDTPNKYAINSDYIEEMVIGENFRIIQDDESFQKAILQGNSKKGMVDDLKEKKIFYEKELKKGLTKRGKFENMVMDFEGGISRVFPERSW